MRVFLTCWLVYAFFWTPYVVREHYPALALVERGSLNVEKYLGWSEDIFRGPNGGAYINNNPGASIAGALPLALTWPMLKRVEGIDIPATDRSRINSEPLQAAARERRALFFLLVSFVTVAGLMAPSTAATAAFLVIRLIEFGITARSACLLALAYAFGTPVFFRAEYLNHNLLVGNLGFVSLLVLWDPANRPVSRTRAFGVGLLCGFAALCDFTGFLVIAVVAVYLWLRSAGAPLRNRLNLLFVYGCGVLPGVIGLILYQAVVFGNPVRPSQHYMAPTAPTSQGYRGFSWPSPTLLWANFFDPRFGLFAYCPLLLASLFAPWIRKGFRLPGRETKLIFGYFLVFVLFCSANRYSWLQPSTGFRYLVPIVPFLFLLSMETLQAVPGWLRGSLVFLSVYQNWAIAGTYRSPVQTAITLSVSEGWRLQWMQRLEEMELIRTGWMIPVTLHAGLAAVLVLLWIWPASGLSPRNRPGSTKTDRWGSKP